MAQRFLMPIALAFALMATGAAASDGKGAKGPVLANPAPVYKDLPGVVSQGQQEAREQANEPKCTTALEYRRWYRGDIFDDGFPVEVYRCQKGGFTYSGTEMPNRPWVPGLHPHFLPAE